MPTYDVTLNEIEAKTYRVKADTPEEALYVAKTLDDPSMHLVDVDWIDYWGDQNVETDVQLSPNQGEENDHDQTAQ